MTAVTSCTARLVFAPETHVAFDRIATLLSEALANQSRPVTARHSVAEEMLFMTTEDAVCCLETARDEEETLVSLTIDSTGPDYRARLARILYRLMKALPATHLIWNDCEHRLTRALFFDNLTPDCDAKTKPAAPRRVQRAPQSQTRARLAGDALRARMQPVTDIPGAPPLSNDNDSARRDADQQTRSRQIRDALLSPVAAREIIEIHAETADGPTLATVAARATSLSAAALSNPALRQSLVRNGIGPSTTISVALAAISMLAAGSTSAAASLLASY